MRVLQLPALGGRTQPQTVLPQPNLRSRQTGDSLRHPSTFGFTHSPPVDFLGENLDILIPLRSLLRTLVSLPQPNTSNPLKTCPDEAGVIVRCKLTDQTVFSAAASFRSAPVSLWTLLCRIPLHLDKLWIGVLHRGGS